MSRKSFRHLAQSGKTALFNFYVLTLTLNLLCALSYSTDTASECQSNRSMEPKKVLSYSIGFQFIIFLDILLLENRYSHGIQHGKQFIIGEVALVQATLKRIVTNHRLDFASINEQSRPRQ